VVKLRSAFIASPASLASAVVLALSLAGCGNLLGLKDLEPYPADGSADSSEDSSSDGTTADTVTPGDGPGVDGHDAAGPGDSGTTADSPGADAPEDTSSPVDSSMGHDSSTGPDSSMGVDSSTGMDSSTVEDTSTGPDSSCTTGSQTDSHNCGSCGHDCLGGNCSGGLCQPFTLATSVTGYDMVVSNGTLFWVDQVAMVGNVWTCTVSNNHCTPGTFASNQNVPERITLGGVGNGTVFWSDYGSGTTNDGTVMSLPLAGGPTPFTEASNLWIPQGVGADATYLFWVQSYSPTNNPTLTRLTLSNMSTSNLPTGAGSAPTAVAVGGGTVYWSNDLTTNGAVDMSPEDSLSLGTVDTGQSAPYAISVDGTYVYWVDYTATGTVWQYTISNSGKRAVGTNQNFPTRVVSDTTHAYWIDEGVASGFDGSLVEWDVASSSSVIRASGLARPSSLAMDANAVYFTTLDDGLLQMMVR
jgi:hypothetical protein